GNLPATGSLTDIAIGSETAKLFGFTDPLGKKILLTTTSGLDEFRISGVVADPPAIFPAANALYVDASALTTDFALGLKTPLVAVKLRDGASAAAVVSAIKSQFGGNVSIDVPADSQNTPQD